MQEEMRCIASSNIGNVERQNNGEGGMGNTVPNTIQQCVPALRNVTATEQMRGRPAQRSDRGEIMNRKMR